MPLDHLPKFEKHTGRPCPYVDLEPENETIGPVSTLALYPDSNGWALTELLRHTVFMEPLSVVVWRIIAATRHERVTYWVEHRRNERIEAAKAAAARTTAR